MPLKLNKTLVENVYGIGKNGSKHNIIYTFLIEFMGLFYAVKR